MIAGIRMQFDPAAVVWRSRRLAQPSSRPASGSPQAPSCSGKQPYAWREGCGLPGCASKAIIAEHIQADRMIGIHVPATTIGHDDAWQRNPGDDLFTDSGETRALD